MRTGYFEVVFGGAEVLRRDGECVWLAVLRARARQSVLRAELFAEDLVEVGYFGPTTTGSSLASRVDHRKVYNTCISTATTKHSGQTNEVPRCC
jgi:hypothetical protein